MAGSVKWVNLLAGVPTAPNFNTTGGLGTPINIDQATAVPYALINNVVTPLSSRPVITPRAFGATDYNPTSPVYSTVGLQAFFDHATDPNNARLYVYDFRGNWLVNGKLYAAYWDGHEPNYERRFIMGTFFIPQLSELPGGVALDYVIEIAGFRQKWEGVMGIHEVGANAYNNTTYYTRRFVRGVHIRAASMSVFGDFKIDGAKRDDLYLEGWEAGFTVRTATPQEVVFPIANSIGCELGHIIGRYSGSGEALGDPAQSPNLLTISAKTHGHCSGAPWSAEAFTATTAGYEDFDPQRTKITLGGGTTTADLVQDDLVWGRVELTPAIYGTIAATADADPTTGTFVWSAGDPTNLDGAGNGLKIGDDYPIFLAGPNVGKEFVITGFSGGSNRTIAIARKEIYDTSVVVVAHAATADATYRQWGPKSWHWVAQVIDGSNFTVTPWLPGRINSQLYIVLGSVFKSEGDDTANVKVSSVLSIGAGHAWYSKGNFAPSVGVVLGQTTCATVRLADPSYQSHEGIAIYNGHSEGCYLDLISGYSGINGQVNLSSLSDPNKFLAYTPRHGTNDQLGTFPRQLGRLQVTALDGTVHDFQFGGTQDRTAGYDFISNAKVYRHLYLNDDTNFNCEVRYDAQEAFLNSKNHWAEITRTGSGAGAAPGTLTLTLSKKLIALGWLFDASSGGGTTYTAPLFHNSYKVRLLYYQSTKRVGIQIARYFLDSSNNFRVPASVYIGEYSAGAGFVDNQELVLRNTSGYGLRVGMNGATSALYVDNQKPGTGFSEFNIRGLPIVLWGDGAAISATVNATGINLAAGKVLQVNGTSVVGPRGAAVAAPAGGATVDAESRTAISALISRLQAHGLIA